MKPIDDQIAVKLLVTCLNEEGNVLEFIEELMANLSSKIRLALVLVNNGSNDQTGSIINKLAQKYTCITTLHRDHPLEYGASILNAHQYPLNFNPDYIGWAPSDNQISGKDTAKTLNLLISNNPSFVKVERYEKNYSLMRKIQSYGFNIITSILYQKQFKDINGSPKLFHAKLFSLLDLQAKDWFLDGEAYLKVSRLMDKDNFIYVPARFNERTHGKSKTRWSTAFELFVQIVKFRLWGMPKWLNQLNV
ncbi:MAG: glycosyltransferase [Candidatus Heimdallarchaeota archaeon]|nr:MAG: glycosyltransferase [Candidatus Heimdallarchaeota archaeon]